MNTDNKKKSPKTTIHTTISSRALEILDKYLSLKNEQNESVYTSKAQIIEEALELFDRHFNPQGDAAIDLWQKFRQDLNMVSVGKRTFLAYISGDFKKAYKENIAPELLEWYKKKLIAEMSVEELLQAIKDLWLAGNYFYKIDLEPLNRTGYKMSFYHDMQSQEYSKFWGEYFSELLAIHKNCKTRYYDRNQMLILEINGSS